MVDATHERMDAVPVVPKTHTSSEETVPNHTEELAVQIYRSDSGIAQELIPVAHFNSRAGVTGLSNSDDSTQVQHTVIEVDRVAIREIDWQLEKLVTEIEGIDRELNEVRLRLLQTSRQYEPERVQENNEELTARIIERKQLIEDRARLRELRTSVRKGALLSQPMPPVTPSIRESLSFTPTDPISSTLPSLSTLSHPSCETFADDKSQLFAYEDAPNISWNRTSGKSGRAKSKQRSARIEVVLPHRFLEDAGIADPRNKSDVVLFVRDRCFWQIKFIKHDVIKEGVAGYIQGHPGTGKSTTALTAAAALCRDEGWDVLWIHVISQQEGRVLEVICLRMRPDNTVQKLRTTPAMCTRLIESLETQNKCLLVLDGVNRDISHWDMLTRPGLVWFKTDQANRRFLCLSSQGFDPDIKDQDANYIPTRIFRQWSWTLSEYREALTSKRLYDTVKRALDAPISVDEISKSFENSILAKYFYAGGCARYMFSYPTHQVQHSIRNALNSLEKKFGTNHDIGLLELSNRLFSLYAKDTRDVVSQYARFEIQTHLGARWLLRIAQMSGFTTSARGCLFQAWFVKTVEDRKLSDILKQNGKPVDWWDCHQVERRAFDKLDLSNTRALTLIDSTNEQEPSIDALYYRVDAQTKSVSLLLFQITISRKHELDMAVCSRLARQFQAAKVEIYFVIPSYLPTFAVYPLENIRAAAEIKWPTTSKALSERLLANVLAVDGWPSDMLK